MIRTLVVETYGGKIDDEGDFARLTQLVHSFLTPAAYDIGHKLVKEQQLRAIKTPATKTPAR
jgi:dynein heavy chain 1